MKKTIRNLIIEFIILAFVYYIFLPPINLLAISFWIFIIFALLLYAFISFITSVENTIEIFKNNQKIKINGTKKIFVPVIIAGCMIFGIIIINFIASPIFNADSYAHRITVTENGNFSEDFEEVDFSKLALIDRDSSEKLGDRVMGQFSDFVSQYRVSNEYRQINYNDKIMRVTPLEYDGLIKWINNKNEGIKGYITVDSVSGEAKLVKLEKGLKYMPSAYFSQDLKRKLRFTYPTDIFGTPKFEIDNEGNPYWIVPIYSYGGINIKEKVVGVILLDPITGKSEKMKLNEVPDWVDNVYEPSLIIEQVNDWGTYREGFLNSIFGQKNVVNTTEGYNYLVMKDDVFLYTGITSVLSDESNLGFILTNLRNGETTYYLVPGAEEYSAMSSAEGQVQQMGYTSTFPLLINLNNRPTYFVSLKDAAGLVKMYGFVDVTDYQKVTVTDSSKGIVEASINYLNENNNINEDLLKTKDITISEIIPVVKNGNTYFYIKDTEQNRYVASISLSDNLAFLKSNDSLSISFYKEKDVIEIIKIN